MDLPTTINALTFFVLRENSGAPLSANPKKTSTKSSSSDASLPPLLIFLLSLCSSIMLSRILSAFLCIFSRLDVNQRKKYSNFNEGSRSPRLVPAANFRVSMITARNSSCSLPFFPKAILEITPKIDERSNLERFIGDPALEAAHLARLEHSYSLIR